VTSVAAIRQGSMQIEGDTKTVLASDPVPLGEAIELKVSDGSLADLTGDAVFIYSDPAEDLGLSVGDTVTATFPGQVTRDLRVAGIFDDASALGVNWIMPIDTFGELLPQIPTDFQLFVNADGGIDDDALKASIEMAIEPVSPQADVQTVNEFLGDVEQILNITLAVVNGLLLFAVIIAAIGVFNTLALSIYERVREFGLLRAVGTRRSQVSSVVLGEGVIVCVFGALLGLVVGIALGVAAAAALPSSVVSVIAVPTWLALVLVVAIVFGLVAAFFPSRSAAKVDVLEAIATT
jgi:putative ABC transport system permease protein